MDKFFERCNCSLARAAEELEHEVDGKPAGRPGEADGGAVTAPRPRGRMTDEPCLHGIPHGVRDRRDEVCLAGQLERSRPVPKQVIAPSMTEIRDSGVVPVQLLEARGESRLLRPEHHVVMIRHQTPREDLPRELARCIVELTTERLAVVGVDHDALAVAATAGDVVRKLRIDRPEVSAHRTIVASKP